MAKKRNDKPEYSLLGIKVDSYNVTIAASINPALRKPHDCLSSERTHLYETCLEIEGTCNYPEERSGELFTIVLRTAQSEGSPTLKDCRIAGDNGMYLMRTVKGQKVPAFEVPKSLDTLSKRRGVMHWDLSLRLPKEAIANILAILPSVSPLYFDLHEVKEGKEQHIRSLALQMNDPARS